MSKRRSTGPLGALTVHMSRRRALLALGGVAAQLPLSKPSAPAATAAMPARGASASRSGGARPRAGAETDGSGQPNIILIITDDLDAGALEWMPNISALLRQQGTTFANFFATNPSCGPARATVLRGQYVHNHGMLSNGSFVGGFGAFHRLGNEESTIATWLHDAGYRTALVGKYLNGYPDDSVEPDHVPPGWDEWYGLISTQYTRFKFNDNGALGRIGTRPRDYQTDVLSRRAQAFVREATAADEPFFLYIAPKAPHDPATPAPRHEGAFADFEAPRSASFNEADVSDKPEYMSSLPELDDDQIQDIDESYRQRLETMLAVDEMVAALVELLRASDALDQTYIFFTSDNGFFAGEHRLSSGKGLPYDESLRLPLLVRGPGVIPGRVEGSLTNNADLAPTIAELAGAAIPDFVDGRSLAPMLRGEEPPDWRQVTLVEDIGKLAQGNGEAVGAATPGLTDDEEDEDDPRGNRKAVPAYRALRTLDWLYVDYATGERELYDLRVDPHQMENIAGESDPILMERFAGRLDELAACAGTGCQAIENAPIDLSDLG